MVQTHPSTSAGVNLCCWNAGGLCAYKDPKHIRLKVTNTNMFSHCELLILTDGPQTVRKSFHSIREESHSLLKATVKNRCLLCLLSIFFRHKEHQVSGGGRCLMLTARSTQNTSFKHRNSSRAERSCAQMKT